MHGRRQLLFAALLVLLWVLGGALIYHLVGNCSYVPRWEADGHINRNFYQCPWTYGQSFYFSVQTGLSIGFGLLAESTTASQVYSIFHIMVGSSVVSGALALFAQLALTRSASFQSKEEARLAEASAQIHADGYSGFKFEELRALIVKYTQYANSIIRKVESDPAIAAKQVEEYKAAGPAKRMRLATQLLRRAYELLPQFQKGRLSINDLTEIERQTDGPLQQLRRFTREHRNVAVSVQALIAWLAVGVLFSMFAEDNDFVTALYFAVSTLSTAGMVSVRTVANDAHVIFVAFFALVGVPIYCVCLGMFANVLIDRYNQRQVDDTIQKQLSQAETEFLKHICHIDNKTEAVDFGQFVEFQLLRMGKVDRELLETLRRQFAELDTNQSGHINAKELVSLQHAQHALGIKAQGNPEAQDNPEAEATEQIDSVKVEV